MSIWNCISQFLFSILIVFLTAYIQEVGFKTVMGKIKQVGILLLLLVSLGYSLVQVVLNLIKINPESLNINDVISICGAMLSFYSLVLCAVLFWAFKRLLDGRQRFYQIINKLVDRIKQLEKKPHD